MTEQEPIPTAINGRARKPAWWLITAAIIILAVVAGAWLLPRLLGADGAAIAQVMPEQTAVFAEINLLNLQNSQSRQVAAAFAGAFTSANIPFNSSDPTTAFNLFDPTLQALIGLTVSEDVRPWVGLNAGLGLLPPGADGLAHWVLAATVRNDGNAEAFVEKVTAAGAAPGNGLFANQPVAARVHNLVIVASDPATLAAALAAEEELSLADSRRYQQTLARLAENRALTVYLDDPDLDVFLDALVPEAGAGAVQAIRSILPDYTAVGMAAYATSDGIQVDIVGPHNGLNETQRTLLAAQTAAPAADALLPQATAVYLSGQRPDLLWQLLKGSLGGLGYSEADVDEAMALFTGLFGFNPDTDLLATLNGAYAVALLPTAGGRIEPGLEAIALAEHANPTVLAQQAESLATGLTIFGMQAVTVDNVYQVMDANNQPLAAYTAYDDYLLVGTDAAGVTAVTQATDSLAGKPAYQGAWRVLPDGAAPVLFVDAAALAGPLPPYLVEPIAYAVFGVSSSEEISRGTLILRVENSGASP